MKKRKKECHIEDGEWRLIEVKEGNQKQYVGYEI